MGLKKGLKRKGEFKGDEELDKMASKKWGQMSPEEKNSYKEQAKAAGPYENKKRTLYNSQGIEIVKVEAEKSEKLSAYHSMVSEIKEMINTANEAEDLENLVFHFISTTSFYASGSDIFPAELAMAKFSLVKGVFDDIQIRINPGELPLGSAYEAGEKSRKEHKYPLHPKSTGEENYVTILTTMIEFLSPMEKLPVFFAQGNTRDDVETLRETRRIVEKILYEAQEDEMIQNLKIYPIDELFFALQRTAVSNKNRLNDTKEAKIPSIALASRYLKNEIFNFSLKARGCDFHETQEALQYCCLTKVRSFGYTFSKWCSTGKSYELQEGRHHPAGYEHKN